MARPRQTGPVIGFRLPTDLHEQLTERAGRFGETPAQYVKRQIVRALKADQQPA